ncbi:MAG: hypothetical protein HS051_03940 [Thaumarchaeota archaeon]|nr:hypothetical protein [Nitrososphaerota archaeon]NSL77528.1 hypothetical protein [Nitrososphaerota archaeon]
MGKEKFPTWLAEEISSVKMKKSNTLELTGYLLDINKKENKIDVQFYEQLPDGRQIATLVIGEKKMLKNLEEQHNKLGEAPEFNFKFIVNKASLSDKAKEYLTENYSVALDNLYGFELESFDSVK